MNSIPRSRNLFQMSLSACKNGGIRQWHCPVCQCLPTLSISGTTISAESALWLKMHFESNRRVKVSWQGNCHLFPSNCQFVQGDRVYKQVRWQAIVWCCVRSNGRTSRLSDHRPTHLESCSASEVTVVSHSRMCFFGRFCGLFTESEQSTLW